MQTRRKSLLTQEMVHVGTKLFSCSIRERTSAILLLIACYEHGQSNEGPFEASIAPTLCKLSSEFPDQQGLESSSCILLSKLGPSLVEPHTENLVLKVAAIAPEQEAYSMHDSIIQVLCGINPQCLSHYRYSKPAGAPIRVF